VKIDKKLVGAAIARFRKMRGLTQSQLNKMAGLSTVQHIEQGVNSVSIESMNRIAEALGVPASCIVVLGSEVDESDKLLPLLKRLVNTTLLVDEEFKKEHKNRGPLPTSPKSKASKRKAKRKHAKKKPANAQ